MLESLGFDSPDSLKRFLVMVAGPIMAFVNVHFGVGVPDVVVAAGLGLLATYIWQSGHKASVALAVGAKAADAVSTLEAAAKVLGGPAK